MAPFSSLVADVSLVVDPLVTGTVRIRGSSPHPARPPRIDRLNNAFRIMLGSRSVRGASPESVEPMVPSVSRLMICD